MVPIQIELATREALRDLKHGDDTYDAVIQRLMANQRVETCPAGMDEEIMGDN